MNPVLLAIAVYEGLQQAREIAERLEAYREAEAYARSRGKPLLIAGMPRSPWTHGAGKREYGDVVLDINPLVLNIINGVGVRADVRWIPYSDKHFGAALVSHTLEHLRTKEDALMALRELNRVADRVFVVGPSKTSILAWLHGEHRLWVQVENEKVVVEERSW